MMKFTLATLAMAATVQATTRNLKSGGGKMKGMKDKYPAPAPVPEPEPAPVPVSMTPAPTEAAAIEATPAPTRTCMAEDVMVNEAALAVLSTVPGAKNVVDGLKEYMEYGYTIGSITALIPEASDAAVSGIEVVDGESGDIDFPHGPLKPIATVGERSVCMESMGEKITGVPDGMGAYLSDDATVRVVVQSESYGPISQQETFPFYVNDNAASITGSHLQYVDYDREGLAGFMAGDYPASDIVVGAGEMIQTAYNLKGELIGPRNGADATEVGAHFGNTDADGKYVASKFPSEADWFYQSFCSAHMEEQHQWGEGIGVEDDLFITNEEWMIYDPEELFVGIGAHVIDVHTKTAYAVGAFSLGGFEKITEINPQHPDYVMFAVSGYNGDFSGVDRVLAEKNNSTRPDGTPWVWTQNIVPFRLYVGVKGKMEDGSDGDDFLARNGLRYGKLYGYAVNLTDTGDKFRDDFHKDPELAYNGAHVPGKWIAQTWQWDGEVKNFMDDGSWDWQVAPDNGMDWWVANSYNESGAKTEHCSPDPRAGITGFIQGSTAGYFGHLYVHDPAAMLADGLPEYFDGSYYVYQGELDVTAQIELNGKGQYAEGRDATRNWDSLSGEGKVTFEDIDGLEVVMGPDEKLYAVIQEDSGNDVGERMLITQALEHENDGNELTYYFVAMSGGSDNTRISAPVGIPKGTGCPGGNSHEFSGVFDLSGLLHKNGTEFSVSAADTGKAKRDYEAMVPINDKDILIGLQAHSMECGIIVTYGADRGGQWLIYHPEIPM